MSEILAWYRGHVEGLRRFAWWKDGVEYVGTCGTTLADAIERARVEYWTEQGLDPRENGDIPNE